MTEEAAGPLAADGEPVVVEVVAARPAPGDDLGPSEVSVPSEILAATGSPAASCLRLEGAHGLVAWASVRVNSPALAGTGPPGVGAVRLGRTLWGQLDVKPGDRVLVEPVAELPDAEVVRVTPAFSMSFSAHQRFLERLQADGTPLFAGSRILAEMMHGGAGMMVRVDAVEPSPARFGPSSDIEVHKPDPSVSERVVGLADVGGAARVIRRLRELVELPLLRPGFYRRLGVRPPKGILLQGPPGTGKTLVCRALANDLGVAAFKLASTELVGSAAGETEANLRLLFSRALAHAPALVVIDEFDVIATHRERLASQSDIRATSQLLTLLDGLEEVDGIVVIGTTNRVQAIDPAFRRPGRFEEEVLVGPPDEEGRLEILSIHTREMPLSESAQQCLGEMAAATGGFVGADLMHLARTAGLFATQRLAGNQEGFEAADWLEGKVLAVEGEDFEAALRVTRPSVLRDVVATTERITWDQIVGQPKLKPRLLELGRRVTTGSEVGRDQGVLLYGPPGSGKSALVHALASELGVNFVKIEGSKVFNQWLGESEQALRALFRRATEARPSILLLDHLDVLAPARAGGLGDRTDERVVSALLEALDESFLSGGVLVVGVSSRPELIDPAVVRAGRLGVHLEVPDPDADRRRQLLDLLVRQAGIELEEEPLQELVESTSGWSAADIVMLVNEATKAATQEQRPAAAEDLTAALAALHRMSD